MRKIILFVLLISLILPSLPVQSADGSAGLSLEPAADGMHLTWQLPPQSSLAQADPPPTQQFALHLPDDGDPTPQIRAVQNTAWAGALPTHAPLPEQALPDGNLTPPLPQPDQELPDAPITLLREGRLRDLRIGVYAVNPVYLAGATPQVATRLDAFIPGARPLPPNTTLLQLDPLADLNITAPAPNPLAARAGWTISVTQPGLQVLSAEALRTAGLDPNSVDVSRLQLSRRGTPVALEEQRSGNTLVALRFYAPTPGDRWNIADNYWLDLQTTPGLRITTRDARPVPGSGSTTTTTATETGIWREPRVYESTIPNPDGDRFVSVNLRTAPGGDIESATFAIATTLPRAGGPAALTVSGGTTPQFPGPNRVRVSLGTASQEATLSGVGPWTQRFDFAAGAAQGTVALLPNSQASGFALDRIAWEVPVQLSFGGRGAAFSGRPGHWAYQLAGLPSGAALYDVSAPARPQRLTIDPTAFEDNAATPRTYLLAGPGTTHTPAITARAPVDIARARDVTTIYVVPAVFRAALEPLLAHRNATGTPAAAITAEAAYAGWSGGMVDPEAIRSFLRYAAATWRVKPTAVVLVGDGTSDPRNYLGIGQVSWLPPYLANVDPWLGETACETCYGQLHGDDPLDDPLPDLAVGRLPVKSANELSALITKIIGYETNRTLGSWRSRVVAVADNADTGGDFALTADRIATLHPPGVERVRIYFDPAGPANQSWRIADSQVARDRTFAAFTSGAGLLSYTGHGLQYQWAVTAPPANVLLFVDDPALMQNAPRLPIVLSMTCLTGAFQQPAVRGTTIDEALVLSRNGGAIAVWGSSGLGVLFGHDALERGFITALWATQPNRPQIGDLTLAGYLELFTAGGRGQESLRTFVLLGDPRTRAQVQANGVEEVFLPIMR
jgi:hypothetical protein